MQIIYQFEIRNIKNIQEINLFQWEDISIFVTSNKKTNKISFMDNLG